MNTLALGLQIYIEELENINGGCSKRERKERCVQCDERDRVIARLRAILRGKHD